jgi:hypothetical protein
MPTGCRTCCANCDLLSEFVDESVTRCSEYNPAIDLSNFSAPMIGSKNAGEAEKTSRVALGAMMRELTTKEHDSTKHDSWLSLVLLCIVTALSAALGFGVLFAGASVAYAIVESSTRSTSGVNSSEAAQPDSPGNEASAGSAAQAGDDSVQQAPPATESNETSGRVFTGMITDSRCGARHSRTSGKTSAECVRACLRKGSHFVLVDGEDVHALEGDPVQLDQAASVRVEVVGLLRGDTIKVKSVAMR